MNMRFLIAAIFAAFPALAYAQTYPSPVVQQLTVRGCSGYLYGNATSTATCATTIPGAKLAPGAAETNLGFTPANKAGDTFTGSVTSPGVVAGAPNSTSSSSGVPSYVGGVPVLAQYASGLAVNSLIVSNGKSASNTVPESNLITNMISQHGYANKLTAYKAGWQTNVYALAGSANIWGGVINMNHDATAASDLSVIGFEIDYNNANRNCATVDANYCVGQLITAPDYGFYSASALAIEAGNKNWNYGVTFNGPASIRQAAIYDASDAAQSYKMEGTHSVGIDAQTATITGLFLRGPGGAFTVDPTGNVVAASVTAATVTGTSGMNISSGQSYKINGATVIDAAAWTTWSPTVTPSGGSFTTLGTVSAAYKTIGKTAFFRVKIPITTNGTASGLVNVTLPATLNASCILNGKETTVSGKALTAEGVSATSAVAIANYDGSYPGANGATLVVNGVCEIQ